MNGPLRRAFQAVRRLTVALVRWILGLVGRAPGALRQEMIPGGEPSEMVSECARRRCNAAAVSTVRLNLRMLQVFLRPSAPRMLVCSSYSYPRDKFSELVSSSCYCVRESIAQPIVQVFGRSSAPRIPVCTTRRSDLCTGDGETETSAPETGNDYQRSELVHT